jgi:hypothetical protein
MAAHPVIPLDLSFSRAARLAIERAATIRRLTSGQLVEQLVVAAVESRLVAAILDDGVGDGSPPAEPRP